MYSPGRMLICKIVPSTGARTRMRSSVVFACAAWDSALSRLAREIALSGSQAPALSKARFALASCICACAVSIAFSAATKSSAVIASFVSNFRPGRGGPSAAAGWPPLHRPGLRWEALLPVAAGAPVVGVALPRHLTASRACSSASASRMSSSNSTSPALTVSPIRTRSSQWCRKTANRSRCCPYRWLRWKARPFRPGHRVAKGLMVGGTGGGDSALVAARSSRGQWRISSAQLQRGGDIVVDHGLVPFVCPFKGREPSISGANRSGSRRLAPGGTRCLLS